MKLPDPHHDLPPSVSKRIPIGVPSDGSLSENDFPNLLNTTLFASPERLQMAGLGVKFRESPKDGCVICRPLRARVPSKPIVRGNSPAA